MADKFKTFNRELGSIDDNDIGIKLQNDRLIEQACQHYRKVLTLNPSNAEAHKNFAVALRQKGEIELAVEHLERALHLTQTMHQSNQKLLRIFYFCPDLEVKSGGVRRLYRHVDILVRNGFSAAILHAKKDSDTFIHLIDDFSYPTGLLVAGARL